MKDWNKPMVINFPKDTKMEPVGHICDDGYFVYSQKTGPYPEIYHVYSADQLAALQSSLAAHKEALRQAQSALREYGGSAASSALVTIDALIPKP